MFIRTIIQKVIPFAICICLLMGSSTYAHEMFNELVNGQTVEYPVRWNNRSGNLLLLDTNADYLSSSSPYKNNYSGALSMWSTYSPYVIANNVSFSYSKVDIVTCSSSYWQSIGGGVRPAFTEVLNTDGTWIKNTIDAKTISNHTIKYARIYINPSTSTTISEYCQTQAVVHELGHALGLGHSDSYDNVLNQSTYNSVMDSFVLASHPNYPTSHDNADLKRFYGFPY